MNVEAGQQDVMQEITQVIVLGAIGSAVLFVSACRVIELWPRFIEDVEAKLTDGLLAALRAAVPQERGH